MSEEENSNRQIQSVDNSMAVQPVPNVPVSNRRDPRNMQGLLNFLIRNTSYEDNTTVSQPVDEDRREFLRKVFESMNINIGDTLTDALTVMAKVEDIKEADDPSECENAINAIIELVDEVDIANDFQRIGGLQACKPCLSSPHAGIRWRAALLIGECSQNNPHCQEYAIDMALLTELTRLLDTDTDDNVRIKALFAISTIIRGNNQSIVLFHDLNACQALMKALQSNNERLKIKVAFLLSTAFSSDEYIKIQLQKIGVIKLLIQLIKEAVQDCKLPSMEHYLGALMTLSKDVPEALNDCREPNLNFVETLDEIIGTYRDESACIETINYATSLKNILHSDSDLLYADR